MNNKKRKIVFTSIVLTVIIFFAVHYIYDNYYKIDVRHFHFCLFARAGTSEDKEYNTGIWIYRTAKDSNISYIMGRIYKLDAKGNEKSSKIIFWQKVKSSSIKSKKVNGTVIDNWIDFMWIDSKKININGITVNINKPYDYRRK